MGVADFCDFSRVNIVRKSEVFFRKLLAREEFLVFPKNGKIKIKKTSGFFGNNILII